MNSSTSSRLTPWPCCTDGSGGSISHRGGSSDLSTGGSLAAVAGSSRNAQGGNAICEFVRRIASALLFEREDLHVWQLEAATRNPRVVATPASFLAQAIWPAEVSPSKADPRPIRPGRLALLQETPAAARTRSAARYGCCRARGIFQEQSPSEAEPAVARVSLSRGDRRITIPNLTTLFPFL